MSDWIITYKGEEFVFPNFSGALENVVVPNGNNSLSRSCPISGDRKDKMTDDERAGFLNLQLNHGNIIADNWNTGVSEWVKFKMTTQLLLARMNNSLLLGEFDGLHENLDEVLGWLSTYETLLKRNRGYVIEYRDAGDNFGSGCGNNGRCREKLCHSTGFWEGAVTQYDTIIPQVEQQIYVVSQVKNALDGIESGDVSLDVVGGVIAGNADDNEDDLKTLESQSKWKGVFIAIGVLLGVVAMVLIIKKIQNR